MPLSDEDRQHIYEEETQRARIHRQIERQRQPQGHDFVSCLLLLGIGLVVLFVLGPCVSSMVHGNGSHGDTGGGRFDAGTWAELFVKDKLKAPSTADFPPPSEENIKDLGNHKYIVTGWVDAQNSFGAKIRSHWTVTLHDNGNNNWEADNVDIEEP